MGLEEREWGESNRRKVEVYYGYLVYRFNVFIRKWWFIFGNFYFVWFGLDLELNGVLMVVFIRFFLLLMNCG